MEPVMDDDARYMQIWTALLENSAEHKCMKDFIYTVLPDILASIGAGKSTLNVMGVGSGSGDIDVEILKVLHEKHPGIKVEHEVVEPSSTMLNKYRALLSRTPGLDYASFKWNEMTSLEFETEWKHKNSKRKMHFISMIQMLYYVEDLEATISFFQSLLHKDGKLLIIFLSGESSWARLPCQDQLYKEGLSQKFTTREIKSFLDSKKISYKNCKLPSLLDITECFIPADEKGEVLLDLLTEVRYFSKTAPPEIKDEVLEFLKHPDNIQEVNGRILFDTSLEALVIDA